MFLIPTVYLKKRADLEGIVIHKCVTCMEYTFSKFSPQINATDQLPRANPVLANTGIWLCGPLVQYSQLNTMARILERGITLVHPYSRNKSDQKDKFIFLVGFEIE